MNFLFCSFTIHRHIYSLGTVRCSSSERLSFGPKFIETTSSRVKILSCKLRVVLWDTFNTTGNEMPSFCIHWVFYDKAFRQLQDRRNTPSPFGTTAGAQSIRWLCQTYWDRFHNTLVSERRSGCHRGMCKTAPGATSCWEVFKTTTAAETTYIRRCHQPHIEESLRTKDRRWRFEWLRF